MDMNFAVADVPVTATPQEAAAILNRSCTPDFRVVSIVPWAAPGVGARVFMVRKAVVQYKGTRRDRDGKEQEALALIQANPEMSSRNVTRLLREHDIVRGKDWVVTQRALYRNRKR